MVETDQENLFIPNTGGSSISRPMMGWVLSFGLLISLLGLVGWGLVKVRNGPIGVGMAPDFSLTTFEGETITLSELRGKVVIINFWASWCPPC